MGKKTLGMATNSRGTSEQGVGRGRPIIIKRMKTNWMKVAQHLNKWKNLRKAYFQQWTKLADDDDDAI